MKAVKPVFVLAHNIRSLHNVGSIFRTSDVFGVAKLMLTGYTGHPPDPKLAKVALGADKAVSWEYQKSPARAVKKLKTAYPDLVVLGLENNLPKQNKKPVTLLHRYRARGPVLLVLGEEVDGIAKHVLQLCDAFLEIRQFGAKESLNVSVAFGIAAYELAKPRV